MTSMRRSVSLPSLWTGVRLSLSPSLRLSVPIEASRKMPPRSPSSRIGPKNGRWSDHDAYDTSARARVGRPATRHPFDRRDPATVAVQRETRTIPIIFGNVAEPIASGIVPRLDRPGGNITGFASFEATLGGKWLVLLL